MLIKCFADTLPVPEPIYEFGSFQIGPKGYADLRPYFPSMKYVGCDFRKGPGVDQVEDLASLSLSDKSVGTVICMETIEHVFQIFRAFQEMQRVLVDEGVIIVSSVMDYRIHSHPFDYWRFTPDALEGLLGSLPLKVIGFEGIDDYPHTVWGVGFRTYNPTTEIKCEEFCERYRKSLLELKHQTWQQHSLNGKFKFLRKLATYKVFGPKIEYAKGMLEFRVKWKIVRSVG